MSWIDGVPGLWRWLSVWLGGRDPYGRLRRLRADDRRVILASKDAWDHLLQLEGSGLDMAWWRSVALVRAAGTTLHPMSGQGEWRVCLSALFWDVGLPLLMHRRPYGIDGLGRLVHVPRVRRVEHEQRLFGRDHQALGRQALEEWGLHALEPSAVAGELDAGILPRAVALADLFQTLGHPEACLVFRDGRGSWDAALVEAEASLAQAGLWARHLGVRLVACDAVLAQLRAIPRDDV